MQKKSGAARRDVTNTFASKKRVVRSGGSTPAGTARAENPINCAAVKGTIDLVGAVPAESVPGSQYNGH